MTTFRIRKIGVLGAGMMGSGIACHLAGVGFKVMLLDRPGNPKDRNEVANKGLQKCLSSKPNPVYHVDFIKRIETGNFEDDWNKLTSCDWIIESIVEDLTAKRQMFEKLEPVRSGNAIVSSNTSGLPVAMLMTGRSENFKSHFLGTHFFNPPRYISLLEIIPGKETKQEVVNFMMDFGSRYLGKQTVLCKDSPGFVGNRIILPYMMKIMELSESLELPISLVDKLTGPAMGRPKSGTFRLADLVGLDTAVKVWNDLQMHCPTDSMLQQVKMPSAVDFLLHHEYYGHKSGIGFYKRSDQKDGNGKNQWVSLDLATHEYGNARNPELESVQLAKQMEDIEKRLKALFSLDDAGARLIKGSTAFLWAYAAHRIPEICDTVYGLDQALCSGFGWTMGPFQLWDCLGFQYGLQIIRASGYTVPEWVERMEAQQVDQFYRTHIDGMECLDPEDLVYKWIPGSQTEMQWTLLQKEKRIYQNEEIQIIDLGDGVLCVQFTSKSNIIGEGVLRGILHAIDLAETQGWKGLVIGNPSEHFTVGANLLYIGMMAFQKEYQRLDEAALLFQQTSMRCRYSAVPVVCACQGYTFGGGVELLMHCDAAVAHAESYIGLVEMGVGILPCGGGTKEFARRLSMELKPGEVQIPQLMHRFKTLATAAVSTSAFEAFDLGYLDVCRDDVCFQKLTNVRKAKLKVLKIAEDYIQPIESDFMVMGKSGLATIYVAAHSMWKAGFASEHDLKIAQKIAFVLCGGDLSSPQKVSESYLLDLEREAFLSLCSEPRTLERIQYMLENRKPLRN